MPISLVLMAVSPAGIHLAAATAEDRDAELPRRAGDHAAPPAATHARHAASRRRAGPPERVNPAPAALNPVIPRTVERSAAVPADLPDPLRGAGDRAEQRVETKNGVREGTVMADAGSALAGMPGGMPDQAPEGFREEPFDAGFGGVSDPVLIDSSWIPPRYPELARQAGVQGKVLLQAVIRKDGTVGNITVLRSAGARLGFDEAAVRAVGQWRYKPGLQNGRPVDVTATILVDFSPPH